jgi:flagellar hook-associated protein 3 FlgL
MQVTETYLSNYLNNSVNTSSSALTKVEQQLSTGLAINQPSDNPAGTDQILTINDSLANITQYQSDANNANNVLSYTDSQLQNVQNLMTQARTIAVAAASGGTQNADEQAANAAQISDIISQVTNLANSQLTGNYIFSGTATATKPYTPGDTTYTYNGNSEPMTTTVGPVQEIQTNTPGSTIFAPIFSSLQSLESDISSGNITNISNADLGAIDSANTNLSEVRANIGSTLNQVTSVTSDLSTMSGDLQNELASVQDVNIATVYTQLQTDQNVYQASLEATADAFKYSLSDFISA